VLKTLAFKQPYLLRCGKSCIAALFKSVKDKLCLACVVYIVRENAQLFKLCFLLVGSRSTLPAKGRNI